MSHPIAPIVSQGLPQQGGGAEPVKQQGGSGRSFQSVLEGATAPNASDTAAGRKSDQLQVRTKTSGARIDQLRLELMERTKHLPSDRESLERILPEMSGIPSRRNMLQEAMRGIKSPVLAGNDFKTILSEIENRWLNVERIMTSDQNLSTGELLGLQARLYQVSQHVEVVSRVIDQVTGGIKTILNTNV